ncbi:MAG: hypothetical protein GKS00_11070 [Alphaproteobacteria bacterium]|nr:hypothetical protein [Alphaproteobacteria bacterium]
MENRHSDVIQVVHDYMSDPETRWAIGERAVFARDADDETEITLDHAGGVIVTDRGAVRIALAGLVQLAPVEIATGQTWSQAALLCLREDDARMPRRTALTELGSDMMAARPEDRVGTLFDLGLGLAEADCCVRTADPSLYDLLQTKVGNNVADDTALMDAIKAARADYVTVSRLGRIEAFGGALCDRRPAPSLPTPVGYAACLAFVPPQQAAKPHSMTRPTALSVFCREYSPMRHMSA